MKKSSLLLALCLCASSALLASPVDPESRNVQPSIPEIAKAGYQLAWSDEFNGSGLDNQKWGYRTDSKWGSTQKLENVTLSGGNLHLNVKKEEAQGKPHSGAGVISKMTFQYGYYEARFKVPQASGWHTSFWMQKYDNSGGTSPKAAHQELDVCENDSAEPSNYRVNVHKWISPHVLYCELKPINTPDLSRDFHVFACEFTPKSVKFFFEGALVKTVDATQFKHGDQNIWLTTIANTEGVDDAKLPAAAVYDYVRFFKKTTPAK